MLALRLEAACPRYVLLLAHQSIIAALRAASTTLRSAEGSGFGDFVIVTVRTSS
jgi:hypothetical protein